MTTLPMTQEAGLEPDGGAGRSRPEWVPDELFPFASRYLQTGDAHLHYVDEGAGPTLLLVAGSPMWSFMYRSVILELRRSFRCVAVDLAGLGLSRAPLVPGRAFANNAAWLQAFIDALDLNEVTLVAHATAGPPALEMAINDRVRFRSLVVSNSFGWPLEGPAKLETIVRFVGSRPFALANIHLNFLGRLSARFGRRGRGFTPREQRAILGPYVDKAARRHLQNFLFGIRAEREFFARLENRIRQLADLPVQFIYGVHDNGYAAGFLERWKTLLPRHEVVLLEESGHFPVEDEPYRFIASLNDWLTRSRD